TGWGSGIRSGEGSGHVSHFISADVHSGDEMFDPSEKYKMDHKRRGLALIFNHERFYWQLMLPERRGTSADRENLTRR
uniref:Caspase family p20 domain-containing protein n=1 Tax=Spermophilus dauricus TaxID=99837 RepID=A0A8C9PPU6_SPEDA